MASVRLTEKRIRDLKTADKTAFAWDANMGGFGVRVSVGGTKSFVQWSRRGEKKTLVTIGRTTAMTLEAARRVAANEQAGAGVEPGAKNVTVTAGCRWFLEVHCQHQLEVGKMAPRTATGYAAQINKYVIPHLGHLKINEVKRTHVERLLAEIGPAKKTQFVRVRALIRSQFNLFAAEGWGLKANNPALNIACPTERPRERVLTPDEQAAFLAGLARQDETSATRAIELLFQTGGRLSEIRLLRWEYLDADAGVLRLPDSKTGAKTIMLPSEARAIINRCPRVNGNPFIFAGMVGAKTMAEATLRKAARRAAELAGIADFRVHDLRRTFIVDAIEGGIPITVVARLAGHSTITMTARYAKHADSAMHEAADELGKIRKAKRGAQVSAIDSKRRA